MKKRTLGMLVGAAVLSMALGTAAMADDALKVAYIARAQEDSFAAWLADEMRAQFDTYDDMELDVFDGQANDEKENSLIENCIANGYDGIIIQTYNKASLTPAIEDAEDAGIPVLSTGINAYTCVRHLFDFINFDREKANLDLAIPTAEAAGLKNKVAFSESESKEEIAAYGVRVPGQALVTEPD